MITQLHDIAKQMVAPGKGILAADESIKTVDKRFTAINLPNTKENRCAFREMLITAPHAEDYISGVILFDETIRQKASNGKTFVEIFQEKGILPGIKVDEGTIPMPNSPTEKLTKGLDGLSKRLQEYVALGAKFCKWRSVITISPTTPTEANIRQNVKDLATYALLCQKNGLVPMVEPEVLIDGNHSREKARQVNESMLTILFEELKDMRVALDGLILKTSMIVAGKQSLEKETPKQVAQATISLFKKILPTNLAGIAFLSGGQSEIQATKNLNAIHAYRALPWPVTFSYARALQDSATKAWQGKKENEKVAQKIFFHRAKMNSLASLGRYNQDMERKL